VTGLQATTTKTMQNRIVILAFIVTAVVCDPLVVQTLQGQIRGYYVNSHVRAFLGVPFAYPPVGALRLKSTKVYPDSPQWSGVKDTRTPPSVCPQSDTRMPQSEDCLYLNIHAPTNATNLPVIFWIYGGSFVSGAGNLYNGTSFAQSATAPVVWVAINYRLGMLGFAGSQDLLKENGTTGNYGINDQIVALEWVHKNIASFGGDPNQITIAGESAGGVSCTIHTVSPKSRKHFSKTIIQSGMFMPEATTTLDAASEVMNKVMSRLGCNNITCVRKASVEAILTAQQGLSWTPVIDGVYLTKAINQYYKEGDYYNVPAIIGNTANEMAMWICPMHNNSITDDMLKVMLQEKYGAMVTGMIYQLYDRSQFPNAISMLNRVVTHQALVCPARFNGHILGSRNSVYLYTFDHYLPYLEVCGKSQHACEIPFEFPELAGFIDPTHRFTDQERQLHVNMIRYWTNFAASGNPNKGGEGVLWKPKTTQDDYELLLALPQETKIREGYYKTVCDLWDKQMFLTA
jgi:para-nitrobenzyl esterase